MTTVIGEMASRQSLGNVFEFFRTRASIVPARLAFFCAAAGISNATILAILNTAAARSVQGEGQGFLLAMFLLVIIVYVNTQRYLFFAVTTEVENILHRYRMEQVERARHSDLDTLERIGPARIYNGLTRHPRVISNATGAIAFAVQSAAVVGFTLVYLAWLSVPALVLSVVLLGLGIVIFQIRVRRARARLTQAAAKETELFDSTTDLLEGFKEVRLHRGRNADLADFIEAISGEVEQIRTDVHVKLTEVAIFAQLTVFGVAAAMVFLLPLFGLAQSAEILKVITVILFLVGPLSGVVGVSPVLVEANAACRELLALEEQLKGAPRRMPAGGGELRAFREISLERVVYRHMVDGNGNGFKVGPIDLTLRAGDMLFISGGNGSGKSTLLKLLTALYLPQDGKIRLDGQEVDAERREAYQSLFSTVFSDFHLFRRLFGLDNVKPAEVAQWLEIMEVKGKTHLVDGRFDTLRLSTGQRKRLAFIVAMLEDRPIYVFDEWAADQDSAFRRKFYDELLPRLRKQGKTIVAVTHDERYLERATRHLTMEEGHFVEREGSHG
jgi:putative ATP-binding cassette transporter